MGPLNPTYYEHRTQEQTRFGSVGIHKCSQYSKYFSFICSLTWLYLPQRDDSVLLELYCPLCNIAHKSNFCYLPETNKACLNSVFPPISTPHSYASPKLENLNFDICSFFRYCSQYNSDRPKISYRDLI